jgi:large subunit ribosomal protein MRP49
MPYQKIPKALRPLSLKGLPASRTLKQAAHLDLISNYKNSAYKLDNVSKLQIIFKKHNAYGHMGMRQFWKFNLKTLTFHNPELPIEVQRIECATKEEQLKCPSVIKVILKDGTISTIDGKDKQSDDIMNELIKLTNAEKVPEESITLYTTKVQDRV